MICGRCGAVIPDNLIQGPFKCSCGRWLAKGGLPRWVRSIAAWSQPGERGVGDTFHRLVAAVGADQVTRLLKWFRVDCGCEGRRDQWNDHYPYDDWGRVY